MRPLACMLRNGGDVYLDPEYLLLALAILYPILAFLQERAGQKTLLGIALRYVMHFVIGSAESYLRKTRDRKRAKKSA